MGLRLVQKSDGLRVVRIWPACLEALDGVLEAKHGDDADAGVAAALLDRLTQLLQHRGHLRRGAHEVKTGMQDPGA